MSSSSPAWGCGARPKPRYSKVPSADARGRWHASWLTMPATTFMYGSVCASERKSSETYGPYCRQKNASSLDPLGGEHDVKLPNRVSPTLDTCKPMMMHCGV